MVRGLPWIVATMLVIFSVGCASVPADQVSGESSPLARLRMFTKADLTQASAIATANGDTVAAKCFDAINTHLDTIQDAPQLRIKGAFSLYETGRIGIAKFKGGIPSDIHNACAPLVLDAQHTLIRLGLIGTGLPIP